MSEGLLETYGKGAGPHESHGFHQPVSSWSSGTSCDHLRTPCWWSRGWGRGGRSLHHCSVPLTDSSFSKRVSKPRPFLPKRCRPAMLQYPRCERIQPLATSILIYWTAPPICSAALRVLAEVGRRQSEGGGGSGWRRGGKEEGRGGAKQRSSSSIIADRHRPPARLQAAAWAPQPCPLYPNRADSRTEPK